MNKDKPKLRSLLKQPRWKRALFVLALDMLLLWQHAVDYYWYLNFNFLFARRAFVKRTVQRAHYLGGLAAKPHRFASSVLVFTLLSGFFIAPSVKWSLHWAMGWGLVFSLYVIRQSTVIVFRRLIRAVIP